MNKMNVQSNIKKNKLSLENQQQKKAKRLQVKNACLNCRKMHTACNSERPCKRCVHLNIQSACVDVERRRRNKKNEALEINDIHNVKHEHTETEACEIVSDSPSISVNTLNLSTNTSAGVNLFNDLNMDFIPGIISENFNLLNGESDQLYSINTPPIPLSDNEDLMNALNFGRQDFKNWEFSIPQSSLNSMKNLADHYLREFNLIPDNNNSNNNSNNVLPEFCSINSSTSDDYSQKMNSKSKIFDKCDTHSNSSSPVLINPTSPISPISTTLSSTSSSASLIQNPLVSTGGSSTISNMELNHLIQQISELKDTNKVLESKLLNITSELTRSQNQNQNQNFISNTNTSDDAKNNFIWNSSCFSSNIALSVWLITQNDEKILMECNDKFMKLIGKPTGIRSEELNWNDLLMGYNLFNDNSYPQKIAIKTYNGIKEVYVTVNLVQGTSKSFILQVTEAVM